MYLKTAHCEVIPSQINYLIDETSECGKEDKSVISILHHFVQHHNMGEINISLHADNCVGKTKIVLYCRYGTHF